MRDGGECVGEQPAPPFDVEHVRDEVLTHFDQGRRETPRIPVHRHRIVHVAFDPVRLVSTDDAPTAGLDARGERKSERLRLTEEHARVPGAGRIVEDGREGVDADDGRWLPSPRIEVGSDSVMERLEAKLAAALSLGRVEPDIPWYRGRFAHFGDAGGGIRWAVQIDQKARVAGQEQRRVENARNARRYLGRTDVPGDVTIELGRGQTQAAITLGKEA